MDVKHLPTDLYVLFADLLHNSRNVTDILPYFITHAKKVNKSGSGKLGLWGRFLKMFLALCRTFMLVKNFLKVGHRHRTQIDRAISMICALHPNILTSYRVLGIVYLDQLSGSCQSHISYHDTYHLLFLLGSKLLELVSCLELEKVP